MHPTRTHKDCMDIYEITSRKCKCICSMQFLEFFSVLFTMTAFLWRAGGAGVDCTNLIYYMNGLHGT